MDGRKKTFLLSFLILGILSATPVLALTVDYARSPSGSPITSPVVFNWTVTSEASCGEPEVGLDRTRITISRYGEGQINSAWVPYTGTGIEYSTMVELVPTGSEGYNEDYEEFLPIYTNVTVQVQEEATGQGCSLGQSDAFTVIEGGGGGGGQIISNASTTAIIGTIASSLWLKVAGNIALIFGIAAMPSLIFYVFKLLLAHLKTWKG